MALYIPFIFHHPYSVYTQHYIKRAQHFCFPINKKKKKDPHNLVSKLHILFNYLTTDETFVYCIKCIYEWSEFFC